LKFGKHDKVKAHEMITQLEQQKLL